MTSVAIGIPFHTAPRQLRATLASLGANTPASAEIVLLPDGPDASAAAFLHELSHLRQLGTDKGEGAAACFNRLASATQADVVVLLESGCSVGRQWLEGLIAALAADRHDGLAGPSTNASWNEQNVTRHPAARALLYWRQMVAREPMLTEIDRIADWLRQHFGAVVQGLEPLHSLADFCYAVRRDVIEAVGAADEGYGAGPCWEMDYNIRAARAGFRGVWVCASYVHRMPFTERRARNEALLMEASKRRYQDKFCARRLRGTQEGYEPHCRGEACADFAPAELIRIHLPIPPSTPAAVPAAGEPPPMVSCIMATANRPEFVLQSIRYFERQDYPSRELIILDDDTGQDLAPLIPESERISYCRLPAGLTIGAKRNHGCKLARGTFIAQWDDDDWYAPDRLSKQIAALRTGSAQVTALSADVFFDLDAWEFWRVSPDLHRRLFVGDVHGGTLVYHRNLIDNGLRYPNLSLAEDAWFLQSAMRRGARLKKLPGEGLFVYLRHPNASWSFQCGSFLDPAGWQRAEEPTLLAADRGFYAARSASAARRAPMVVRRGAPFVTCIMPTANRRRLVPQAIRYFERQDYSERELLIIDDGDDPVADLIPVDARIRYHRLPARQSLGAKRNLACAEARGEIILHWDDDDWMAPWRVSYQVKTLLMNSEIGACGLAQLYFFDPRRSTAWLYAQPPGMRAWVSGNTLCYRRQLWDQHRFPDINEGEDTVFVWSLAEREVLRLPEPGFYVALVHPGNTSPKRTQYPGWRMIPFEVIGEILREDAGFYRAWAMSQPADGSRQDTGSLPAAVL